MKQRIARASGQPRLSAERGIFLLEALVAVAVFSVALVGLIALQSLSVRHSLEAEDRLTASNLANDIVAVIWVQGTADSSAEITAWENTVAAELPSGEGEVTISGDVVQVEITWEPVWSESGDQARQYTTRAAVF